MLDFAVQRNDSRFAIETIFAEFGSEFTQDEIKFSNGAAVQSATTAQF
jgi:hypothetical protein